MKPEAFDVEFAVVLEFLDGMLSETLDEGSSIPAIVSAWAEKAGMKVPEALRRYKKAGEIVGEQYPKVPKESDQWYRLKVGIFKGMMGFKAPEPKPALATADAPGGAVKDRPDSRDAAKKPGAKKNGKDDDRVRVSVTVGGRKQESLPDLFATTESEVGRTILAQLGGGRFLAMTGATNLVGSENALSMKVGRNDKGVTHVRIRLESDDTYTVEFLKIRGTDIKTVSTRDGVYADALRTAFTSGTGLDTSLGTMGRDMKKQESTQMNGTVFQVLDLLSQTEGYVEASQIQEALGLPRLAQAMAVLTRMVGEGLLRYEKGRGYAVPLNADLDALLVRAGPIAHEARDIVSRVSPVDEAKPPVFSEAAMRELAKTDKFIEFEIQRGEHHGVSLRVLFNAHILDDSSMRRAYNAALKRVQKAESVEEASGNASRIADYIRDRSPDMRDLSQTFRLTTATAEWILKKAAALGDDRDQLLKEIRRAIMEAIGESFGSTKRVMVGDQEWRLTLDDEDDVVDISGDVGDEEVNYSVRLGGSGLKVRDQNDLKVSEKKLPKKVADAAYDMLDPDEDDEETDESVRVKLPHWREVATALMKSASDLEGETDVRLQVLGRGSWQIHTGDASYDTDHHGHWGSGSIDPGLTMNDARELAKDLIAQVDDSVAQSESVDEAQGTEHKGKDIEALADEWLKKGVGVLVLDRISQPSKWRYSVRNPKGGSSSSTTEIGSADRVAAAVLGRTSKDYAGDRYFVIVGQQGKNDPNKVARAFLAGLDGKPIAEAEDGETMFQTPDGTPVSVDDVIRNGDRVTIRTPQGQTRSGKAVMRGPHGWVLNLGGAHGMPGIATDRNVVTIKRGSKVVYTMESEDAPNLLPDTIEGYEAVIAEGGVTTQALPVVFGGTPECCGSLFIVDANDIPWVSRNDRWVPDQSSLEEAKKAKGYWRTTKRGHRIYIENGKITKGNPHVVRAAKAERESYLGGFVDRKDRNREARRLGREDARKGRGESVEEASSKAETLVLSALADGPLSHADLVTQTGLTLQELNRATSALVKDGAIKRVKVPDPFNPKGGPDTHYSGYELAESIAEGDGLEGRMVRAKGVFAKGLEDGKRYQLRPGKPFNGEATWEFITHGRTVARFPESDVRRFLRNGKDGENGLVMAESAQRYDSLADFDAAARASRSNEPLSGAAARAHVGAFGDVAEVLSLSVKLARAAKTLREHGQETLADDLVRAAKAGDRSDVRTVADSVDRLARELSLPRLKRVANAIKDELEDTLGEGLKDDAVYAVWGPNPDDGETDELLGLFYDRAQAHALKKEVDDDIHRQFPLVKARVTVLKGASTRRTGLMRIARTTPGIMHDLGEESVVENFPVKDALVFLRSQPALKDIEWERGAADMSHVIAFKDEETALAAYKALKAKFGAKLNARRNGDTIDFFESVEDGVASNQREIPLAVGVRVRQVSQLTDGPNGGATGVIVGKRGDLWLVKDDTGGVEAWEAMDLVPETQPEDFDDPTKGPGWKSDVSESLSEADLAGAQKYVAAIKNEAKRKYAQAWLSYCTGKGEKPEPGELSVMAAQAVRMALADLGCAPKHESVDTRPAEVDVLTVMRALARPVTEAKADREVQATEVMRISTRRKPSGDTSYPQAYDPSDYQTFAIYDDGTVVREAYVDGRNTRSVIATVEADKIQGVLDAMRAITREYAGPLSGRVAEFSAMVESTNEAKLSVGLFTTQKEAESQARAWAKSSGKVMFVADNSSEGDPQFAIHGWTGARASAKKSMVFVATPDGQTYSGEDAVSYAKDFFNEAKETCAKCGEEWPCSDSKRKDIRPLLRAQHHVYRPRPGDKGNQGDDEDVEEGYQHVHWKGATSLRFQIASPTGKKTVQGRTFGKYIGIHMNNKVQGGDWTITHIPTGLRLGSAGMWDEQAVRFAKGLEQTLGDKLDFTDPATIPDDVKAQIQAAQKRLNAGGYGHPSAATTPKESVDEAVGPRADIVKGMARAMFVSWWADEEDRKAEDDPDYERQYGPGDELMDVAPKTPSKAMRKAGELATSFERMNKMSLGDLFAKAQDDGFPDDPDLFGHRLAMSALGHGVSWDDDITGADLEIKHPHVEYYESVDEARLEEVDPILAIAAIGSIAVGAGIGAGVVKAWRTIKDLVKLGKTTDAEKAYDRLSQDQKATLRKLGKKTPARSVSEATMPSFQQIVRGKVIATGTIPGVTAKYVVVGGTVWQLGDEHPRDTVNRGPVGEFRQQVKDGKWRAKLVGESVTEGMVDFDAVVPVADAARLMQVVRAYADSHLVGSAGPGKKGMFVVSGQLSDEKGRRGNFIDGVQELGGTIRVGGKKVNETEETTTSATVGGFRAGGLGKKRGKAAFTPPLDDEEDDEVEETRETDDQFGQGGAGGGPPLNPKPLQKSDRPKNKGSDGSIPDAQGTAEVESVRIPKTALARFAEVARDLRLPATTELVLDGTDYVVQLDPKNAQAVREALDLQPVS